MYIIDAFKIWFVVVFIYFTIRTTKDKGCVPRLDDGKGLPFI